jgi:hypothetical protein
LFKRANFYPFEIEFSNGIEKMNQYQMIHEAYFFGYESMTPEAVMENLKFDLSQWFASIFKSSNIWSNVIYQGAIYNQSPLDD